MKPLAASTMAALVLVLTLTASLPALAQQLSGEESRIGETSLVYELDQLPDRVLMPGYKMLNCDFPSAIEAFGVQVINLEPGVFMYFVPCANADVNVPHYVALEVAGETDTVEFQQPAAPSGDRVSLISNPEWDQDAGKLVSYQFFSSEQDCGQYEVHLFDAEKQMFGLQEYRRKADCDGVQTNPADYPLEKIGEGN